MSNEFDPLYDWLGIPPQDQPPDHYRLLGVRRFEPSAEVIGNLAEQRISFVEKQQSGSRAAESRQLLDKLASARVCLLSREKRRQYDQYLRSQMPAPVAVAPYSVAAVPQALDPLDFTGPDAGAVDVDAWNADTALPSDGSIFGRSFSRASRKLSGQLGKLRRKRTGSPVVAIVMQLLGIPTAIGLFFLLQKLYPDWKRLLRPDPPAALSTSDPPPSGAAPSTVPEQRPAQK
ncbi:MAG TPA: hypothetical protein VMF30_05960 [Pirellulales bacterium]|nr:hypothetical protein [Pirellulales bacterium]